jgi:3-carboxy-cis,cis-muconate cycloisomerase
VSPFAAIFVPGEIGDAVSDRAWLNAMLDAERALARAEATAGVITADEAAAVESACDPSLYDPDELAAQASAGNPAEVLARELRERAPKAHYGATSQDIVDTAAMLVSKRALVLVGSELAGAEDACAALAETHRRTVMAARTLLQQALPTTFGYKAAGWLVGLHETRSRLDALALPAQLGGAAGTLAALGPTGAAVASLYAEGLGLREPILPWHTIRTPIAELAGALAAAAAIAAKAAGDVVLLAQTEVAEVAERDSGGSSTLPHKRNPINAILAVACERHARANAGILLESVVQEHERAAGAWHAEWAALSNALAATGGAAAALRRSLTSLEVDAARMRANIAPDVLAEAAKFGIDAQQPDDYLGSVDAFIDRALGLHEE